ncbi:nucleoside triphosphate pyrophosphohydrolase [Rhodococcus rhodnii]|uniref:Nucleoside triphosphate pyrophosphohydrolase n=2 Tax=Rhodococcus rhodnii TaxID=38312 RepID=R7WIF2_9NOCA|nr:MazG family protein [Rhodococcus rhodnii]EOM74965.1 nucleoside triphosphate pyrophosphohydrolase [Rhodococcus rhodnii LMG 5362]TXG92533.1 nucleoside triphosphate pyrophosphohydrolase [Rhodococcus rhodnii]
MTVVVLDPARPTQLPMAALSAVAGGVVFTDEVPGAVRELLTERSAAETVVTTDATRSDVRARIAAGETVIASPTRSGDALAEAAELMDRLWGYGGWEVTQSHESLSRYLVEETYEVLDAIAAHSAGAPGAAGDLREELGDLLLQVLFHSRIAQARGDFDVDDVAGTLVAKLVHRSPHLAQEAAGPIDIAEQERAWEERKAAEKARGSSMDGIATSQPAASLTRAVVERASRAGLPDELIPTALLDDAAALAASEAVLRRDVLAFVERIRAAETASG